MNTVIETATFELSVSNRQKLWSAANDLLKAVFFMKENDNEYCHPQISMYTVEVGIEEKSGDWYIIKISSSGELLLGELAHATVCDCDQPCLDPTCHYPVWTWKRFIRIENFYDDAELANLIVHPISEPNLSSAEYMAMDDICDELYREDLSM